MWAWMEYMEVVAQERKEEALDQARHQLSGMSDLLVLRRVLAALRCASFILARVEADYEIRNRSVPRLARPAAFKHKQSRFFLVLVTVSGKTFEEII
jgi:hypothetical protein